MKDVRMAHLNVFSVRNKIDELRCLQLLCRFELIVITGTHLDKTVRDEALQIEGMKLLRLDRKGRKGGGCMLYYNEHLQATLRRDLFINGLEAICLQVKFSNTSALFSVMYRPPDDNYFFRLIEQSLEKAWLKSACTILLGDFNCDFSTREDCNRNSTKLRLIFEMFYIENVIKTATRITLTSRTRIDLIVTTRKDSVGITDVPSLGPRITILCMQLFFF